MRILFTSPVLEHPPAGGSQLRVENSIKALSQLCEMDIISRCPPSVAGGEVAERFYRGYCTEFYVAPSVRMLSANRYKRKLQRLMGMLGDQAIRLDVAYMLEHIDRRNISVIWFGYGNISFPLIRTIKKHRPNLIVICDTDSVWSRFILRELPYAKGLRRLYIRWAGARKEREEKAWVNLCALTTAVSEIDAQYYRSLTDNPSRVRVFSNVLDVDYYANPPAPTADLKHPSIYLAGTFGRYSSPMDVAARWMLNEVLPLVRQAIPHVHFYLVGKDSDRMFGHIDDPHITVTGKLPSVLPYLCHVDVAVVPLKFESGTRFKILEAGACHIPLVSTTLGAEGIPVLDRQHLMIADTPQEFADAIIRLLREPDFARELAENCRQLVEQHYSITTLKKEAESILQTIAESPRP
jgi:glycosyltransferase involved in cell wall biosynthesis